MPLTDKQIAKLSQLQDQNIGVKPEEGCILSGLASKVDAGHAIVEIGAYKGKSTCWIAMGSKMGHGAHIYAIDLWDTPSGDPGYEELRCKRTYADPKTKQTFIQQIQDMGVDDLITPIQGFSHKVASTWDKPVGMLFIDGHHAYKSCKLDYDSWSKYIVPGGYLVFHDNNMKGVKQVIAELPKDQWGELTTRRFTTYTVRLSNSDQEGG